MRGWRRYMIWLKNWRFWLSCTISLLCLWLAFQKVPPAQLVHTINAANLPLVLTAVMVLLLALAAHAQRWLLILDRETGLTEAFWAQGVGFLFINVFPLCLAEPALLLVMAERCKIPTIRVAASAIVERLLDVASNVLVLILVLPWMQVPPLMKRAGVFFGILSLTGLGILLLVARLGLRS